MSSSSLDLSRRLGRRSSREWAVAGRIRLGLRAYSARFRCRSSSRPLLKKKNSHGDTCDRRGVGVPALCDRLTHIPSPAASPPAAGRRVGLTDRPKGRRRGESSPRHAPMDILVSAATLPRNPLSLLPVRRSSSRLNSLLVVCANLPQERIRGGGDKPAGMETPRKPESWVEISESVSRLCSFDAGGGGGVSVSLLHFPL